MARNPSAVAFIQILMVMFLEVVVKEVAQVHTDEWKDKIDEPHHPVWESREERIKFELRDKRVYDT